MTIPKHLFRRTGYGCSKSPSGKHAAKFVTSIGSLESKCLYCAQPIERASPQSKAWRVAA